MPWWPLENTIVAAGLALIVALVCRVRRVPPVVQHALWLVVLIKLITPPFFTGPIQIPGKWSSLANRRSGILPLGVKTFEQPQRFQSPATERQTSHAMNDHPAPADESSEDAPSDACDAAGCRVYHEAIGQSVDDQFQSPLERPTLPSTGMAVRDWPPEADGKELKLRDDQFAPVEAAQIPVLAGHTAQPTRPAEGRSVHHSQPISASGLLTAGFLFTTFVVICVQITRLMRLRLLLKRAGPAPGEFLSIVDELSAMLGVRAPQVRISADIKSPLICAIGRPVLMWPASQLAALGDNALRAVILHELAHLLRRDHLVGWLELVASCFWWWDPLFWYVRHQLRETAELACDAWVTALIPEGRRDYARALVDLAEFDSQRLGTIPALGVAEGSKHLFERRLVMIMGESVRYRLGIFGTLGAVLFAIAALPGCTAGHASEEPLVAVETDDGNVDVGSADDPFNPAGELSAADPAANLPLERRLPDIAETPEAPGAEASPALAEPDSVIDLPGSAAPAGKDAEHDLQTLTVRIAPAIEHMTSVAFSATKLLMRPDRDDDLGRFEQCMRAELADSGVSYGQIEFQVDKRVDFSFVNKLIEVCKSEQAALSQRAKIRLVANSGNDPGDPATSAASNEDRLKRLEDRFDALLKELRDTKRSDDRKPDAGAPGAGKGIKLTKPVPVEHAPEHPVRTASKASRKDSDVETVELARATYKLPLARAQALAAFLSVHLSDEIEVRVKGEAIQVTASREDQAVIAQFIRLLQTRGSAAAKPDAPREIEKGGAAALPGLPHPDVPNDLFDQNRKGPATPGAFAPGDQPASPKRGPGVGF